MTPEQFRARFSWTVDEAGCWIDLTGERIRISGGKPIVGLRRQEGAPLGKHGSNPGRDIRVPRLVYETFIGPAEGLVPHHACGNIACFNPEHLLLGHGKRPRDAKHRCQKCGAVKDDSEMRERGPRKYVCRVECKPRKLSSLWCDRCGKRRKAKEMTRSPIFIGMCKSCRLRALRRWLAEHPEHKRRITRDRRAHHKHRNVVHWREKYDTDPGFRALVCCRRRISNVLKRNGIPVPLRTVQLMGCTVEEFRSHLERQFKAGMTWANHGRAWHIDHIRPLASFNLLDPVEQEKAFHYTNCQPLWRKKNLKKHAQWDGQFTL